MKDILASLSSLSIQLGDISYTDEQIKNNWIGYEPANAATIHSTENRLGVKLPMDYREFLTISNGLAAANNVEPTFTIVEEIDYLKNIDPNLIDAFANPPLDIMKVSLEQNKIEPAIISDFINGMEQTQSIGNELDRSILIAGKNEEQYFLLIPPQANETDWKYWKFAHWIPGEEPYENLQSYFKTVISFNQDELNDNEHKEP